MINIDKIYKMDTLDSAYADPNIIVVTVQSSDGKDLIPIIVFDNVYNKDRAFADICIDQMIRLWKKGLEKDKNGKWKCPECREFDMAQLVEIAKGLKRGQDYE